MTTETTTSEDQPIYADSDLAEIGRDMWAMREALSQVTKIQTDHFYEMSVHRIADLVGFDTSALPEQWKQQIMITLAALSDRGDYQVAPLTKDPEVKHVYIRALDDDHRDGAPFPELFRPCMFANDVKAVCAMVQGGKKGVAALKGLKIQNLSSWCSSGLQRRPADREHMLDILQNYARAGIPLVANHWELTGFVVAMEKIRRKGPEIIERAEEAGLVLWEAERTAAAGKVEPEQEKKPEMATETETETETETDKAVCDRCGKEPPKEGRRVCLNCEDDLFREAGYGAIKPIDKWRSEVEAAVTRNVADLIGGDDETKAQEAGAVAEDLLAAETKLKKLSLSLSDAGIYVEGVNLDDLEAEIHERYAGRAVKANSRRQDGKVLVAGMEFSPDQVRATTDRISDTCADLREIADTLVQTIGESPEMHSALGRDNRRALIKLLKLAHQQSALTLELREYFEEEDMDIRLDRSTSPKEG